MAIRISNIKPYVKFLLQDLIDYLLTGVLLFLICFGFQQTLIENGWHLVSIKTYILVTITTIILVVAKKTYSYIKHPHNENNNDENESSDTYRPFPEEMEDDWYKKHGLH